MKEFRLPDPGEGLVEAEIVTWRVAVGDQVKVNDIVVEVETSKSLVELPTPFAGRVSALLVNEGDMVDVGAPIIAIDDGAGVDEGAGEDEGAGGAEDPRSSTATAQVPAAPPGEEDEIEAGKIGGNAPGGRVAVLVGYGPRTTEAKRRPRKSAMSEPTDSQTHEQLASTFSTSSPVSRRSDSRSSLPTLQAEAVGSPLPRPGSAPVESLPARGAVLAKPPVRKLAKDLGVDLTTVTGTGPGGVITRDDVHQSTSSDDRSLTPDNDAPLPPDRSLSLSKGETRIPVKGVRKMTADAMVASAFTAPHVTEWLTCDVSASMELLDRLKKRREFADTRISPLLLVAKAVCLALARTPALNSHWDSETGEIVLKSAVNLGIAAATPRGLMVPNIKGAQSLSLVELAQALNVLVAVAREGRTQPAEMAQGTFTITNVGVFGIDAGTPILNPGEAGILCLGAIARRPWVVGAGAEERIEPRWVTTLAVSFDHRVVDGAEGSSFLADVAGVLSDPGLSLL